MAVVIAHRERIAETARRHRVAPEAVAGAILWEGFENPSRLRHRSTGPGKVRSTEYWRHAEAQLIEREGRVPSCTGLRERKRRLRQPDWAIEYIAAILARHADVYERVAAVGIRHDLAVLCTLYQGGDSEMRALRLAVRREHDPGARPVPGNSMGAWVSAHLDFVRAVLGGQEDLAPSSPAMRPAVLTVR